MVDGCSSLVGAPLTKFPRSESPAGCEQRLHESQSQESSAARSRRDWSKEPPVQRGGILESATGHSGGWRSRGPAVKSRMLVFLTLAILLAATDGKVFEKCELARIFKQGGLDGFKGYDLKEWVCTAFYESTYNSGAININWKRGTALSMDCGIFQINSFWWCLDSHTSVTKRNCGMSCGGRSRYAAAVRADWTSL
ncbi:lysozyme C-2-like [Amblyraja radiata]|uniref:lysozyme C-2-like n=1 Tax=Amblyraja radiata TaxID=386614 RepID=UPI0014024F29|nr:lysozyme C-2-like [Amblyraja radiata]